MGRQTLRRSEVAPKGTAAHKDRAGVATAWVRGATSGCTREAHAEVVGSRSSTFTPPFGQSVSDGPCHAPCFFDALRPTEVVVLEEMSEPQPSERHPPPMHIVLAASLCGNIFY